MSEDRTQAPTQRRRQLAREHGLVARSADLTAAAGLLVAAGLLAALGDDLALALIGLIRTAFHPDTSRLLGTAEAEVVVGQLRQAAFAVFPPLLLILGGVGLTMLLTHQLQVGGLWLPGRLAPDFARLQSGASTALKVGPALWSLAKTVAVIGIMGWSLASHMATLGRLASLAPADLAPAASEFVLSLARTLAVVALALGAVDFLLAWQRVESYLKQTPDEYREDLKALDGDPAVRARRRALARSWRRDAAEVLPQAVLGLIGPGGLLVLLSGGPPPNRVNVLHIARGSAAALLRREAESAGVPLTTAPTLAAHFGQGRSAGSTLPPHLVEELGRLWPRPA